MDVYDEDDFDDEPEFPFEDAEWDDDIPDDNFLFGEFAESPYDPGFNRDEDWDY